MRSKLDAGSGGLVEEDRRRGDSSGRADGAGPGAGRLPGRAGADVEFQGAPPDKSIIPPEDVLGVAALILTGSYRDQEFVRIGYCQNTEYDNAEMRENPPSSPVFDRLIRNLNDKPRVTRFHVKWDSGAAAPLPAAAAPVPAALPAPVMQNGATNVAATSAAVPSADAL